MRKFLSLLGAAALFLTMLAPAQADARDRRGYHDGRHHGHYGRHYRDNDNDELAAGALGLVLGLALGSMASQPRDRYDNGCYDNYRRCAPPPPPPRYYEDQSYYQDQYDPRYDDRYYEREQQCVRTERQWDRYARRYVMVDVPC